MGEEICCTMLFWKTSIVQAATAMKTVKRSQRLSSRIVLEPDLVCIYREPFAFLGMQVSKKEIPARIPSTATHTSPTVPTTVPWLLILSDCRNNGSVLPKN